MPQAADVGEALSAYLDQPPNDRRATRCKSGGTGSAIMSGSGSPAASDTQVSTLAGGERMIRSRFAQTGPRFGPITR
jgi:hypothetical protein